MFTPEDEAGCVGCSFLSDHLDGPEPHVNARDITLKVVSRGKLDDLQAYRERMGWKFDWVSSQGSRSTATWGPPPTPARSPGFSVFALQDGVVHHTYSSWDRGCEIIDGAYHLIDLSPKGRQEGDGSGSWWRRHDEYEGVTRDRAGSHRARSGRGAADPGLRRLHRAGG